MFYWWTLRQLRSGDSYRQQQAVARLCKWFSARRAVPPLAAFLEPLGDSWAQKMAIEALGRFGGQQAIQALRKAMTRTESYLSEYAARAAVRAGWQPETQVDHAVYSVAAGEYEAAVSVGPEAVPFLCASLNSPRPRGPVIGALRRIGDPRAVPALVGVVDRHHGLDREAAVGALGDLGGPDLVGKMLGWTAEEDIAEDVAAALLKLLGRHAGAIAATHLDTLANLPDLGGLTWELTSVGEWTYEEQRIQQVDCSQIRASAANEKERRLRRP